MSFLVKKSLLLCAFVCDAGKAFFDKKGFISKEFGFTVVHTVVWHFSFQERKSLFYFCGELGGCRGRMGLE